MKNVFGILMALLLLSCNGNQEFEIYSPNERIEVKFLVQEGVPCYSVLFDSKLIIDTSSLGIEVDHPFEGGWEVLSVKQDSSNVVWKPVYGEYKKIKDHYNMMEFSLSETGGSRLLNLQFRVYNEGVAFRYVIPEQKDTSSWQIQKECLGFKFEEGAEAFPIYSTEQVYSNKPIGVEEIESTVFMPLTVRTSNGFASIMEANVKDYPISRLNKRDSLTFEPAIYSPALVSAPFEFPWRMILLGSNEKELIENSFMILNLNPPCVIKDTSWIKAGKTISNEGSVGHKTSELKKIIDFASDNGIQYLQLDWGWYGTEVKWDDERIGQFKKIMPSEFLGTDWEKNIDANPYTVAKGFVPYGWTERWKDFYIEVDLDMQELINYGECKGVGLSLYVEAGHTLPSVDMDSLFSVYETWGIKGVKPGFVNYGKQEDTKWLRNMIELAAKHHLMLCIHDARIPDGITRTYPNLMINEGGGGQECNHDVVQDVMLPFTRCLVGPFDYTPFIYTLGKSHAHMLAFFVTYYGPAQTIRGGNSAWNTERNKGVGGNELEFLKEVPASWDTLSVLSAEIGHHIISARKNEDSWFVGGMCGEISYSEDIALDFLDPLKEYNMVMFFDDKRGFSEGYCPAIKKELQVSNVDSIRVDMIQSGGFVAIIKPCD